MNWFVLKWHLPFRLANRCRTSKWLYVKKYCSFNSAPSSETLICHFSTFTSDKWTRDSMKLSCNVDVLCSGHTEIKMIPSYAGQDTKRGYFPKSCTVPLKCGACLRTWSDTSQYREHCWVLVLHTFRINNTWMTLKLCKWILRPDYFNKVMFYDDNSLNLLGKVTYTHICTQTSLWSVCVYVGVVSVCGPPTWIEPGPVQSTAVSFERPKTKGLKSSDLPLSCVHLIPRFLTLLSLHSALWPGAATCYHVQPLESMDSCAALNVSKRERK